MKATYSLLLGFCLIAMLLSSCSEPTVFGIPQSQWNNLSSPQKQQVIDGYNQRQAIKEQNAPIESAIDAAGTILNNPAIMHSGN